MLQLARFAGVIDDVTFRQNFVRLVLQKLQRSIERTGRNAADRDRVELLHPIERTRDGFVLDRRDRAQRDELVVRTGDVNVLQLFRIQPIDAFDLRDHFVTAGRRC